jgi:hypothetical protein
VEGRAIQEKILAAVNFRSILGLGNLVKASATLIYYLGFKEQPCGKPVYISSNSCSAINNDSDVKRLIAFFHL